MIGSRLPFDAACLRRIAEVRKHAEDPSHMGELGKPPIPGNDLRHVFHGNGLRAVLALGINPDTRELTRVLSISTPEDLTVDPCVMIAQIEGTATC